MVGLLVVINRQLMVNRCGKLDDEERFAIIKDCMMAFFMTKGCNSRMNGKITCITGHHHHMGGRSANQLNYSTQATGYSPA
jgi:hypothetical protein